jgi:hypothetical protein
VQEGLHGEDVLAKTAEGNERGKFKKKFVPYFRVLQIF